MLYIAPNQNNMHEETLSLFDAAVWAPRRNLVLFSILVDTKDGTCIGKHPSYLLTFSLVVPLDIMENVICTLEFVCCVLRRDLADTRHPIDPALLEVIGAQPGPDESNDKEALVRPVGSIAALLADIYCSATCSFSRGSSVFCTSPVLFPTEGH